MSKHQTNTKMEDTMDVGNDLARKYEKKTHLEHIKDLPDTYIGSIQNEKLNQWVVSHYISNKNNANTSNDDNSQDEYEERELSYDELMLIKHGKMKDTRKQDSTVDEVKMRIVNKQITYPPGLKNIIEEILVNAIDNHNRIKQRTNQGKKRLKKMTYIKVSIDINTGMIVVENDGEGIDVAEHPTEKIYIPQMIFGELLTSGNYNKDEEKTTGGKNGYGAKLTNIFSTYFRVETVDRHRKLMFSQEYRNNMNVKEKPVIEKFTGSPFTRISFIPDYERFGIPGITRDLISLIEKRTYDMVVCSGGEIKVYFNGEQVALNNFDQYISLYVGDDTSRVSQRFNERWEVAATLTPSFNFEQVSFVNGINTSRGGRHVEYITKQICSKMVEYIKKKKKVDVKEHIVRDNLMLFVNSTIVNPSFDSQTKDTLTTTKTKFGSECEINVKFVEMVANSGIMERAIALSDFRNKQLLTKTDGKKTKRLLDIEKLDDARLAGTKKNDSCTLILTEGDSAKAMAVAGISIIPNGRDIYGIYPLRGKLLNTRDKRDKDIASNQEITDIKRILGLQENREYNNINDLRYGRIMIMTDQDVDGSHIKGLIINFLTKWPSLMKIEGFITSLLTPIVKAKKRSNTINFYTLSDFEKWLEANNNGSGWTTKYYKGLGTSTPAEAKDYFRDFKLVNYHWNDTCDNTIDMAFNKDRADDRKTWLSDYRSDAILDINQTYVTFTDFINKELIHFSNADNQRSLPSLCDGLKPSQRKILFCCEKRNLRNEIRVAQLAGYVSEHGAYHHGEASLHGTIVGMAQNFTGSNNINLLEPVGQFGSRLKGGKDSAQPRYIHTHLTPLTHILFNKLDNPIYKSNVDDGLVVEPEFYMPIIPLILVNGTEGIGTGWSSNIPPFHPKDLVKNIKRLMKDEPVKEMTPWFRGFKGTVTKLSKNHWLTRGCYKLVNRDTIEITELPVGIWTDNYKILLDELMLGDKKETSKNGKKNTKSKRTTTIKVDNKQVSTILKDYKNSSSESLVNFTLKFDNDVLINLMSSKDKFGVSKLESIFRLTSKITCEKRLNMYDDKMQLKSFDTPEEVLEHYYKIRLEYYQKRKDFMVAKMKNELLLLSTRVRFILDVINGKVIVNNQPKIKIVERLEKLDYPKMLDGRVITLDDLKKKSKLEIDSANYDFLIRMPIYNLTKEKIEELKKERDTLKTELEVLNLKTIINLWEDDLTVFEKGYDNFMKEYYSYMGLNPSDYTYGKKEKVKMVLKSSKNKNTSKLKQK